ncbi:MAG: DNA polymerase III subunit gamma/tau [Endomicrobiaceae bacterium]|jgi:DNA polymerase-3 subunit gamma/tau|nr:DNA polymerase III subunit gamma/tau [Endomicrobiaceae bacterium]
MSYLVLARKFRPSTFDEVIGQEHISQTLKNAINENKVAHAYLFSGPRGTGKTTMARIFAKALNCKEGPTAEPCGKCQNCLEISKNQSIDVFEIDGASNTGVDNIRELRENVKFGTTSSKYKIYIIDEVHQISTAGFNALLKTLEEPPSHVIFILATTEQHKVPITILSRCQKYRFRLLSTKEIAGAIKNIARKDNFEIDDEALEIVINSSGGSMRDALSLLDQAISSSTGKITAEYMRNLIGLLPKELIAKTTEDIANNNIDALLKTCKEVYEEGYNILQFARDLRDHLRQLMIFSVNPKIAEISTEDTKLYDKQKNLFPVSRFIRMGNLISKALEEMKWHDQPRILLELYLLKMAEPYYNVRELVSKIDELGKKSVVSVSAQNFSEESSAYSGEQIHSGSVVHEDVAVMAEATGYDIIDLWKQSVCEIRKKHPMTSQPLETKNIKELSPDVLQISLPDSLSYNMVKEYTEVLQKLITRKAGREITVKMIVDTEMEAADAVIKEDIIVKEEIESNHSEIYEVGEDLKETAKTAVPSRIESIAKKFGGRAIKRQSVSAEKSQDENKTDAVQEIEE